MKAIDEEPLPGSDSSAIPTAALETEDILPVSCVKTDSAVAVIESKEDGDASPVLESTTDLETTSSSDIPDTMIESAQATSANEDEPVAISSAAIYGTPKKIIVPDEASARYVDMLGILDGSHLIIYWLCVQ
jgi:hypothetical protein